MTPRLYFVVGLLFIVFCTITTLGKTHSGSEAVETLVTLFFIFMCGYKGGKS